MKQSLTLDSVPADLSVGVLLAGERWHQSFNTKGFAVVCLSWPSHPSKGENYSLGFFFFSCGDEQFGFCELSKAEAEVLISLVVSWAMVRYQTDVSAASWCAGNQEWFLWTASLTGIKLNNFALNLRMVDLLDQSSIYIFRSFTGWLFLCSLHQKLFVRPQLCERRRPQARDV